MAKIELGSTMYLFLQSPGTYAPALVISAHGGIGRGKTADKKVPFGTLHWYSKHGDTTTDFGIRNFIFTGISPGEFHFLSLTTTAKFTFSPGR